MQDDLKQNKKRDKLFVSQSHPEIKGLCHPEKNNNISLKDLTPGSHREVWWKCPKGEDHEWSARVSSIVNSIENGSNGCPVCRGAKAVHSNCLATTHPHIAKFWHPTKNGSDTPYTVTAGSNKLIWWKCPKGEDHEWPATVNNKCKQGCAVCSGKRVSNSTSLAAKHPDLAAEWHPTRNEPDTPHTVAPGSNKTAWWICEKKHEFPARIGHRTGLKSNSGCPYCNKNKLLPEDSLAVKRPDLAEEWHHIKNVPLTPSEIPASSGKIVWWQCKEDPSHEWQSTVDNRNKGNGCRLCNSGWTIEKIRMFIASLLPYVHTMSQAEMYTLFLKKGALDISKNAVGNTFIHAAATGKFPKDELEKFLNNEPSIVDDFFSDPKSALEKQKDDFHALHNSQSEIEPTTSDELPIIQTKDVLDFLDSQITINSDKETIEFLKKSATSKIWNHAFTDESAAILQLDQYNDSGLYATEVKKSFLASYHGSKALIIPKGYNFTDNGKICEPNLMQRYTAYLVKHQKRLGNWSGTGAGKTLSAILASRVIRSKLTVICCPNGVVDNWKKNVLDIYPDSAVYTKDTILKKNKLKHQYLILNYEFFQQDKNKERLDQLLKDHRVDFVIIDEIHQSKQRTIKSMSTRKRVISSFLEKAATKNKNLHVLGMSATPVINNLFEGKTMLELVTGSIFDNLDVSYNTPNCIALYQKFVIHGVRWIPRYNQKINTRLEHIDCSPFLADIKYQNKFGSSVDVESVLTKAKIPFILENIHPKTIIYTHYLKGILRPLQNAIEAKGWKVALLTGENKNGLKSFISGDADVLITSSCGGTGIDGLQHVCNQLIISSLPWTHAELMQIKGRLYRQGQKQSQVNILIPLTFATINGQRWSYCDSRLRRIQFKEGMSNAAVDGMLPKEDLSTPAQAHKNIMAWLDRLEKTHFN